MAARAWLVAVAVAAVGLPFGASRAEEQVSAKDAGLREARGAVNQVDKDKNRVTLRAPKGEPITLQVDKNTTIFIDGRTGTLDEIKAGADVRASYETKAGANKAQWIEVSKKARRARDAVQIPAVPPPSGAPAGE